MRKYLTNGFSPNMLLNNVDISFETISDEEFCKAVPVADNAIGHDGTVALINSLCGTQIKTNRISIKVQPNDVVYVFGLATRLPEGQVLDRDELVQLMEGGKIQFWRVKVFQPVINELVQCFKRCDEMEYDNLAFRARGES